MKTIPDEVYSNLSRPQRITATIMAEARGDQDELKRLVDTCPKLNGCTITDIAFSSRMNALTSLTLAHELDVSNLCFKLIVQTMGFRDMDRKSISMEERIRVMAAMANTSVGIKSVERAMALLADHVGVSIDDLRSFGPSRDPMISHLIASIQEEADEEEAQVAFETMKRIFDSAA